MTSWKPGANPPSGFGGSPGEAGGCCGSLWDKDTGGGGTEEYSFVSFPGSHHFGVKTWPHPTAYRFHC